MQRSTKYRALLIGCALGIVVLSGISADRSHGGRTLESEISSLDLLSSDGLEEAAQAWERLIRTQGAESAYAAAKEAFVGAGIRMQHIAAHTFGEALYGTIGLAGFPVCDNAYAYGCFHGLFGRAIEEHGIAAARALYATCFSASSLDTSVLCTHGVGHGLVSYFGYDEPALKESLAACDAMDQHTGRNGCLRGVFMEYNLRGVHFVDESAERPFDPGAPMEPCRALSGDQARVCYFSLPQWWRHHLMASGMTDPDTYPIIGSRCATLESAMRKACFEGVGYIAPSSSGFSVEGTIGRCAVASGALLDEAHCRILAANTMSAWGRPQLSGAICEGLSDEAQSSCRSTSEILRDEAPGEGLAK